MTPFEVTLQHELELEEYRFAKEWLFHWHNLNIEGKVVDVDRFDGGRIMLGGITFGDQQQSIYWQAISQYLAAKVHAVFRKWDEETRGYSGVLRKSSLEGTCQLLNVFVAGIMRRGIKTDQAVRGKGSPKADEPYQANKVRTSAGSEIQRLKEAHAALILSESAGKGSWRSLWDAVNIRPGFFGLSVDLKKLFRRRDRRG